MGDSGDGGGIPHDQGVLPVELFHSAITGLVEEPLLLAGADRARPPLPLAVVV